MFGVKFHFLNVGDGDCTIVDFPPRVLKSNNQPAGDARIMMVDIHHHEDHDDYEHVIEYYKKHFSNGSGGVHPIFRFISTHPHKDHIKGLDALFQEVEILNFWDIDHKFQPDKNGSDWEDYKDDWQRYETVRTRTENPKVFKNTDKSPQNKFWDEDRIEILAPSEDLYKFVHTKEDGTSRTSEEIGQALNNLSQVLLVKVNDLKILLTGDIETKAWEHIMANHKDKIRNIDILKAPHHGRESAFHEEAVKWMNPKHIILSASEDCEHAVPEKYKKAAPNAKIYKTCELGTLVFECDFDGTITAPTAKRYEAGLLPTYR